MDVTIFAPSLLGLLGSLGLMAIGARMVIKNGKRKHTPPPPPPPAKEPEKKRDPDALEGLRKVSEWMRGKQ